MDPGGEFNFQYLPNYKFSSSEKSEIKEALAKWSMSDGFCLQAYSFDKAFRKYNERDFILDFFGCQNVAQTLTRSSPEHKFVPFGIAAELVKFREVKCTLTTLRVFDTLKESNKIVRSNGSIVKCLPMYVNGENSKGGIGGNAFELEVADNLRKFVVSSFTEIDNDDDDEDIDQVLPESDKSEFLFALFSHFVIGGSLCQYEDKIEPYIEAAKLIYKDLIAVAKDQESAKGDGENLKVTSFVYKIHSASNQGVVGTRDLLFHRDYINNFMYIVINPLKQLCFTLYHHV